MANRKRIPTDEQLVKAAELRIENKAWEEVGKKLRRAANTVRRWPANYPERWRHALHHAERRLAIDGEAESFVVLRAMLRHKNSKMRWHAAKSLMDLRVELGKLDARMLSLTRNSQSPTAAQEFAQLIEGYSNEVLASMVSTQLAATAGQHPVGQGPDPAVAV